MAGYIPHLNHCSSRVRQLLAERMQFEYTHTQAASACSDEDMLNVKMLIVTPY